MKNTKLSSIELAKLTGKTHDNVMKDIRILIKERNYPRRAEVYLYHNILHSEDNNMYTLEIRAVLNLLKNYPFKSRISVVTRIADLLTKEDLEYNHNDLCNAIDKHTDSGLRENVDRKIELAERVRYYVGLPEGISWFMATNEQLKKRRILIKYYVTLLTYGNILAFDTFFRCF